MGGFNVSPGTGYQNQHLVPLALMDDRFAFKTGTFPIRLKPEDWQSGDINWLLDVIAPDGRATGQVIANAPRRSRARAICASIRMWRAW